MRHGGLSVGRPARSHVYWCTYTAARRSSVQVLKEDGSSADCTEPMLVLRGRVEAIQRAQVALMRPLLFYPPSVAEGLASVAGHRGSKTAFHAFVIFLVQKNVGVLRQVPPPGTSHNSTLVNLFFVVLWFLGPAVQIPAFGQPPSSASSTPRAASPMRGTCPGPNGTTAHTAEATPADSARGVGAPEAGGTPRGGAAAAAAAAETPSRCTPRTPSLVCVAGPSSGTLLPTGARPVTPDLQPRSPVGTSEPPTADLTAIVTARNGSLSRWNGSKGRKSCSRELEGSEGGGRSCGGTPRGRRRPAASSTFWHFPAGDLFLQEDAGTEPYLELNRVGGILSEAAKNRPEATEPLSIDASDVAAVLRNAGALRLRECSCGKRGMMSVCAW